jgi:hypothetical protein
MAMIMLTLRIGWMGTAGAPQRAFLGEDVARREFAGAAEGQVFALGIWRRGRRKPWAG